MKIIGIGVDIVEIKRMENFINNYKEKAMNRLFTNAEIEYCEKQRYKFENYSARFAAKEAFLKALGLGLGSGIKWRDIEIKNNDSGRPYMKLYGEALKLIEDKGIEKIYVSLSHSREVAIAFIILLEDDDSKGI